MAIRTAFGIYDSEEQLQTAVDGLKQAGFEPKALTALLSENRQSRRFAEQNGTTPPYGTTEGPTADRDVDGTLGLTTPTTGPKQGALRGALRVMGIPAEDADEYGDPVKKGHPLLSVTCRNGDAGQAMEILRQTGANSVGEGQVADPLSGRPDK
jgi:hypothetical protein